MNNGSTSLPNNPEQLKEMVVELQAKVAHQSDTIDRLIEAIALARQQFFGSRGQKVDVESTQLSWLFNEAEAITILR